jgi:hypothetical protein
VKQNLSLRDSWLEIKDDCVYSFTLGEEIGVLKAENGDFP